MSPNTWLEVYEKHVPLDDERDFLSEALGTGLTSSSMTSQPACRRPG
jgi:hypothetical protein